MLVVKSADIASKYHHSKDVLFTEDSLGPSRPYSEETNLAMLSPVATVEGMVVVVPREPGFLAAGDTDIARAERSQKLAVKRRLKSFMIILVLKVNCGGCVT